MRNWTFLKFQKQLNEFDLPFGGPTDPSEWVRECLKKKSSLQLNFHLNCNSSLWCDLYNNDLSFYSAFWDNCCNFCEIWLKSSLVHVFAWKKRRTYICCKKGGLFAGWKSHAAINFYSDQKLVTVTFICHLILFWRIFFWNY